MNNLRIPGTLESREVAEMVEKRHTDLLRDIENYCHYMEEYSERKIASADFFVESTYIDQQGKPRKCYLVTKKGCELIGNKLTGAKGIQFTALYVQRFNEMEQVQRAIASDVSDKLLRAEAMLLNAKTRQYKAIMAAYGDTSGLDPASVRAYSLRAAETVYDMDMGDLLPASEKTYSAKEIGQMLGGIHQSAIGKKASKLGLKTPEFSIVVRDVTPGLHKPVDCYRYNERAVQKLREHYGYETGDDSITETE